MDNQVVIENLGGTTVKDIESMNQLVEARRQYLHDLRMYECSPSNPLESVMASD